MCVVVVVVAPALAEQTLRETRFPSRVSKLVFYAQSTGMVISFPSRTPKRSHLKDTPSGKGRAKLSSQLSIQTATTLHRN